jgi:hypothetical protein
MKLKGKLSFLFGSRVQARKFIKELDNLIEKYETEDGDCFFQFESES